MEIQIQEKENFWNVKLNGRFVAANSAELHELLTEGMIAKKPYVLFDLGQMTHIDSSGLGELVKILQHCKKDGGIARIACLEPHPRIIFDITKVFRVFEIFDTVEECEKSFV